MDPGLRSNQIILALTGLAGLTGLGAFLFLDKSVWSPVVAAGVTFLAWAIGRELDPDRHATALLSAAAALGVWFIVDIGLGLLAIGGFLGITRIIAETTGRRPLNTDLIVVVIGAAAISFTSPGFVAGFGLAVSIYVDNRMAHEPNPNALLASLVAAVGSTVVATLTGAFPQQIPEVQPVFALATAVLALLAVVREPPDPTSQVDSRRRSFIRRDRIHAARITVGLLLVVGALISGSESLGLMPVAIVLAFSLASSELERIARARR